MPRLGIGLPLVSSLQESPITLIEDLLWEDIDTNNSISVNYQGARTNSILRSQDITNAEAWSKTNVAADSTLYEAPDGSDTANAIKSDSTGEKAYNITQSNLSVTSGKTYTLSVYLKKQNLDFARIYFSDGASKTADFNLNTGVVGATSNTIRTQVDEMDNGWYRCSMTFVATSTVSSGQARFYAQSASGDNTPNVAVSDIVLIYVWGFQLEENSEPSPYIVTTNSSRTTTETFSDLSNIWDFDGVDLMPEEDPDSEGAWEVPANLVLNNEYEELGSELVTNGGFATDSNWSYNASYWSISGGTANALGVANGGFSQTLSVTSGKTYKVQISSTITSGNGIYAVLLGTNQKTFDNNTSEITTYIVASGDNVDISIRPGSSAFSMSSISVKQVDPNDRWTLSNTTIKDGVLNFPDNSSAAKYAINSNASMMDIGGTYEITLTVNKTAGGVLKVLSGTGGSDLTPAISISSSGTHTFTATNNTNGNRLFLYTTSGENFQGTVDNVTVREYAIQPQDV